MMTLSSSYTKTRYIRTTDRHDTVCGLPTKWQQFHNAFVCWILRRWNYHKVRKSEDNNHNSFYSRHHDIMVHFVPGLWGLAIRPWP